MPALERERERERGRQQGPVPAEILQAVVARLDEKRRGEMADADGRCRQTDTRVRVRVRGRGIGSWWGSVRLVVVIFNYIFFCRRDALLCRNVPWLVVGLVLLRVRMTLTRNRCWRI